MSVAAARSPSPTPHVVMSTSATTARDVLSLGTSMWVWERRLPEPLGRYARDLASGPAFSARGEVDLDDRAAGIEALLDGCGVPSGPGRAVLAQDAGSLAFLLATAVGARRAGVRIENDTSRGCPLFHVDHVGLRLLCTYAGPGTEWLAERDLVRSELGLRGRTPQQANASIASGPVRRTAPGHVAILKGALFPGEGRRGLVHRSPDSGRGPRLLVAVDVPDLPAILARDPSIHPHPHQEFS